MADFEAVNSIYEKCFKDHRPARAAFQVAKLPRNGRVEIEAVAVVGAVTSGCVMQYS
jgi:enamine deaminase RidA (YjgF/YER057c/UK114 family)